jgi:hypothetical protein
MLLRVMSFRLSARSNMSRRRSGSLLKHCMMKSSVNERTPAVAVRVSRERHRPELADGCLLDRALLKAVRVAVGRLRASLPTPRASRRTGSDAPYWSRWRPAITRRDDRRAAGLVVGALSSSRRSVIAAIGLSPISGPAVLEQDPQLVAALVEASS